jgi:competence protein ComEC
VAALRLAGKRWPWPVTWLLACAVVVVADPWALLQAGFWLSFVAVGILFATSSGAAGAYDTGARGRFVVMFREQWVITLALTPLTLLLFGQVSVVGLAANALAIPWVTLVVTPLAMLGVVVPALWDLTALSMALLSVYLHWLAALPFATLSMAQAPLWAGAAGLLGGALLAMPLPWALRCLGLPLILPVLLWQAPRPASGEFDVMAADIGQGNAVLVRAAAVLAMQPNARLVSSIDSSHALQAVRPVTRCEAGQRWQWDGVNFEVLHPLAADYGRTGTPNSLSCTLRVSTNAQAVLLAGDIEQAQEARLVAQGAPLKADVLLVPHHGSKTSSSGAFLDAVKPRIALVQSGYRNRFGHPAPSVLVRYAERHIEVLSSPHCGAMHWQSVQPAAVNCERQASMRYWHHRVP